MNMLIVSRGYFPTSMPAANDYNSAILGGFSQQSIWSHMGRGQSVCGPVLMPLIPEGRSGGLWDIMRSMPSMTSYSNMEAPVPMDNIPGSVQGPGF